MKNTYKIKDLVKALDRDKTTILRWEKQGFIPPAKRDSRGWRYYTDDDFKTIVSKVKKSHYFNPRLAAMVVALIIAINIFAFFTISKFALGNANLNVNLSVTAGALSVTASTTVTSFSSVNYAFTAQTSTVTNMGGVGVTDSRGGAGTWTFNISCADSSLDCMWRGTTEMDRFATFRGGAATAFPSTSGILCLDLSQNRCVSQAGDACTTVTTQTGYNCYAATKADITWATGASANGEFWFAETDWAQAVPGLTTATVYTTTLIWDLSRASGSTI